MTALVTSPLCTGREGGISKLFSSFKSEECTNSECLTRKEGHQLCLRQSHPPAPATALLAVSLSTTQTEPLCLRGSVGALGDRAGDVGSSPEAGWRPGSEVAVNFQRGARPGWWGTPVLRGRSVQPGSSRARPLTVPMRTHTDTHTPAPGHTLAGTSAALLCSRQT